MIKSQSAAAWLGVLVLGCSSDSGNEAAPRGRPDAGAGVGRRAPRSAGRDAARDRRLSDGMRADRDPRDRCAGTKRGPDARQRRRSDPDPRLPRGLRRPAERRSDCEAASRLRDVDPLNADHAGPSVGSSRPTTSPIPVSTSARRRALNLPTRCVRRSRSIVPSWLTFTTLARGRFASPFRKATFPGIAPNRRFDVMAATTVVLIALRLNRSCCTTTAGLLPSGSEPRPSNMSQ